MADGITVRIDAGEFGSTAARLQALLADMTEPMDVVGRTLHMRVLHCFDTESSPSGAPWAPLALSTIAQRQRLGFWPGKILDRHGVTGLLGSITHEAGPNSVELGTNSPHAGYLQLGTKKMPARKFLFEGTLDDPTLPDEWLATATDILNDYIFEAEEGR